MIGFLLKKELPRKIVKVGYSNYQFYYIILSNFQVGFKLCLLKFLCYKLF